MEYTKSPRRLSQLECSSGDFNAVAIKPVAGALAATIPDPESVAAIRLRLDRPVGIRVFRLHTINPTEMNQDLWTVASQSPESGDGGANWRQSSTAITRTPQFAMSATTTSRDVLISSFDLESDEENQASDPDGGESNSDDPQSEDHESQSDDPESSGDAAEPQAADAPEREPSEEGKPDAETAKSENADAKRSANPALTRLPDAGIEGAGGFLILALGALLTGTVLAFTMRPNATSVRLGTPAPLGTTAPLGTSGTLGAAPPLGRPRLKPGVRLPINGSQSLGIDVRIPLSSRQAGVAQLLLDGPQVGAALEQVGGRRVAQSVRGQISHLGLDR